MLPYKRIRMIEKIEGIDLVWWTDLNRLCEIVCFESHNKIMKGMNYKCRTKILNNV